MVLREKGPEPSRLLTAQSYSHQLGLGAGVCVCVCLFVCLNPLKYHMYNKALFSSCRLCRAISSPYTLVCPMS